MNSDHSAMSQYLIHDLAAAHRNLHAHLNEKFKSLGVQVETWRVLETLSAHAGYTMGELAVIVLMNPPTLTKLVDRMVANGLVQRKLASEDLRRVHLVLTDAGDTLVCKVRQFAEEQNRDILNRIGPENARILRDTLRELT